MKSLGKCFVIALLAATPSLGASEVHAEKEVIDMKLVYWRAFHGTIELTVTTNCEQGVCDVHKGLHLTTSVSKANAGSTDKPEVTTKELRKRDLRTLIQFANDAAIRKSFAGTPPLLLPDGSALEVTFRQNRFGVIFFSQQAFDPEAPEVDRKLGALAIELMKLGGIAIPDDERY